MALFLSLNLKVMIEVGSLPSGNPTVACGAPLPKLVKEFLYTYNSLLTTEYVRTSLPKIIDFCSHINLNLVINFYPYTSISTNPDHSHAHLL